MRWFLLVLLLTGLVRAEDPGPHWIAVLEPSSGKLLAHYRVDEPVREQIKKGQEVPHFAFLLPFFEGGLPALTSQPSWHDGQHEGCKGRIPSGQCIIFREKAEDRSGEMGLEDEQGQFHLLVPKTTYWQGGRSTGFVKPLLAFTGPYLLSEDPGGAICRLLPGGKQLWKASWQLGHARLSSGAWLVNGALYVDTLDGLSKVDPASGKRLWNYAGAGEVRQVRLSPQGQLFVEFIYPPGTTRRKLGLAAAKRFGWPWKELTPGPRGANVYVRDSTTHFEFGIVVVPYQASYFGFTYRGPVKDFSYDFQAGSGKAAVWEYGPKGWSFIFEYTPGKLTRKQQTALYAKNGFSEIMRRRLTADFLE